MTNKKWKKTSFWHGRVDLSVAACHNVRVTSADESGDTMSEHLHTTEQFKADLRALGVGAGDTVMMHASFRSLGGIEGGAAALFHTFFEVLGEDGTLILPAFSYATVTAEQPLFDQRETPSCVGYLPEFFRTQVDGVVRSVHATHSCSLKGKRANELADGHEKDLTPVGKHSPIAKLPLVGGKILILGSHPDHNTSLHGVEELVEPPYLYGDDTVNYVLKTDADEIHQTARRHGFQKDGFFYAQKYARVIDLMTPDEYTHGRVLDADCWLLSAEAVWRRAHEKLLEDPLFFVDKIPL